MSLKLYYDLLSQPSRALYIFLSKAKVPFEKKLIKLQAMDHHSPAFEAVNPFKKVPAIEHDDFKLGESVGIARYICREFEVPDHWYPSESKAQAKVDEYLEWQHLNTRLFCARYFLMKFLQPLLTGKPVNPNKVERCEIEMAKCLDQIENIWLKDTPFLVGNKITVADIFGACEVEQPRMAGYNPREGRPRLSAWLDRVAKETSPYYEEAHKPLNSIASKAKASQVRSAL